MTSDTDRKMFAPLRNRESVTPEAKLCAVLTGFEGGMVPVDLAVRMVNGGFACGTKTLVTKRVGEMLDSLEQEGRVERVPDGRYRAVRTATRPRAS